MWSLIAIFAAVILPTVVPAPWLGGGWYWDAGNGIGFAAFAGMLYLGMPGSGRRDLRAHQVTGYGVLLLTLLHAFWFLLGDGAAVDFLHIGAPDYMWLGLAAVLLLGFLVTVALVPDRFRVHRNYPNFRYWHRVLAVAAVAAAAYHIVVSNFYLAHWYQAAAFVLLAAVLTASRRVKARLQGPPAAGLPAYLGVAAAATVLFAAMRNLAS